MKATVLIQAAAVAAFAFTAFAAHAAPQEVKTLPRVVITGKAVKEVAQLPRVVVVGVSDATLLRQQTLAATKGAIRRA
ncbi:hypothetical protein ACG02S_00340 [Roseateles sp. DC23W]|uniref:TonB-dependent receptor n=1 Tax=Pelomonas dachongensis TaxID=3299029 RepID=A0ABW7EJY7_9BURK